MRKVRDAEDARTCLEAVSTSGLTLGAWTRANGVDGRSLQAWKVNLGRGARRSEGTELRLVELVAPHGILPARYVVRCGDLAVEVDERFDPAVLRRLLAVVASC